MPIFFSHWNEALFLLKSWNKKWGTLLVFEAELQSADHMHFLWLLREDWGEFQNGMHMEGERRHWITRFFRIYIGISQLGRNVVKMTLKWKSKWDSTRLTSTIEVLHKKVELSNTRTAYVMHIPNTWWLL